MYGMINMEAIPKFDIKSVIKSDITFDISTKSTTWIGHQLQVYATPARIHYVSSLKSHLLKSPFAA